MHDDLPLGGVPLGDVTGLANALAALARRPVAILDPFWRLLGYSSVDDAETDRLQREVILRQEVPAEQARDETRKQLFADPSAQRFWTGAPDDADGLVWRVGIGVTDGGEPLGMIWVLEGAEQLPAAELERLAGYAGVVAMHLSRLREVRLRERARAGDLVSRAVEDGDPTALRALGIEVRAGVAVVAARPLDGPATPALLDGIATALAAYRSAAACALIRGEVVLLAPGSASDRLADVLRAADPAARLVAGVGTIVATAAEVPLSAHRAGLVLASLRRGGEPGWASVEERWADAALQEIAELIADRPSLLIHRGRTRDAGVPGGSTPGGSVADPSVLAWIEHHGDVRAAAGELGIHPNTLRYRLRRATAAGLELADPTTRLMTWLRLRIDG